MSRPYAYRVTEKLTGKWYIGSKYGKSAEPSKLGVSYFTSSDVVEPLFRRNPAAFDIQILVISDSNYVRKMESTLTKMLDARNDPMSFNEYNGSQNGVPGSESAARNKVGAMGRSAEKMSSDGAKGGNSCAELKRGIHGRTPEEMSEQNREAARVMTLKYPSGTQTPEQRKAQGEKATSQKWKCLECGMVSNPPALGRHQKFSGHSGKIQIV